jgi:hypothetical protein
MATMLEIVTDLCGRQNIPVPTTVYGTSDPQVRQIMRLLEEEGNDLSQRGDWEALTNEAALTTLALEDQGAIASIATNGFSSIKNNTIWDRTNRLPVLGPMDGQEWQAMKAVFANGPRFRFRIRGGHLLVNPTPSAGYSWYFEYMSKNWILNGSTYKRRFTADADTILLPEDLCLQGLRWRWKKEKGMDYAEDFRTYEMQVKQALGGDGGKAILSMNPGEGNAVPGIWVSPGNWPL